MRQPWAILFVILSISNDAFGRIQKNEKRRFQRMVKQENKYNASFTVMPKRNGAAAKKQPQSPQYQPSAPPTSIRTPKPSSPLAPHGGKSRPFTHAPVVTKAKTYTPSHAFPKMKTSKLKRRNKLKSSKSKLKNKRSGTKYPLKGGASPSPSSFHTSPTESPYSPAPFVYAKTSVAPSIRPVAPRTPRPILRTTSPTTPIPVAAPPTTVAPSEKPIITTPPPTTMAPVTKVPITITTPPPTTMAPVTKVPSTSKPTKSISNTTTCTLLESNTTDALESLIRQANGTPTRICSFEIAFDQQLSLDVPVNLTCQGACVLDGNNVTRLFSFGDVQNPSTFAVFFQGFSFVRGRAAKNSGDGNPNGGAVVLVGLDETSVAQFSNCTFAGNVAESSGGAISLTGSGKLLMVQSVLNGNQANQGGALYGGVDAILTTTDSTFQDNVARGGGRAGAAIAVDGLVNCVGNNTFDGNVGYPNVLGPSVGCGAAGR